MSIKNRHATFTTQRAAAVQVLRKLTEVDKNCKKSEFRDVKVIEFGTNGTACTTIN